MPFGNRKSVPRSSAPRNNCESPLRSKHVRYALDRDWMTVDQGN